MYPSWSVLLGPARRTYTTLFSMSMLPMALNFLGTPMMKRNGRHGVRRSLRRVSVLRLLQVLAIPPQPDVHAVCPTAQIRDSNGADGFSRLLQRYLREGDQPFYLLSWNLRVRQRSRLSVHVALYQDSSTGGGNRLKSGCIL